MSPAPDLHDYANFRLYLRDVFAWQRKRKNEAFLQRSISETLGVASTGFLSNMLAGRKNLTAIQTRRLASLLGLGESDSLFFDAMVQYGQAREPEEKQVWFERMAHLQTIRLRTLQGEALSLFSRPELVFLFEWLTFSEYDGDSEKLGRLFDPPFSASQVENAFKDLERLRLVGRDSKGRLRTVDHALSSGQNVKSADLVRFHERCMALARRSLRRVPASDRDLGVLTLGLSAEAFEQVKTELASFRRRLMALALQENAPDRLYQFNFHAFPLTRSREDGHG